MTCFYIPDLYIQSGLFRVICRAITTIPGSWVHRQVESFVSIANLFFIVVQSNCSVFHRSMGIFITWLLLAALCIIEVHNKVITVDSNSNDNDTCCTTGGCPCGSLILALQNLTNNSIINITSESVTLHTTTPLGSGNLHNITITGNGATIMCNNSGGVYCESCSNVTINGITWDQCSALNITGTTVHCYNFLSIYNNTLFGKEDKNGECTEIVRLQVDGSLTIHTFKS